MLEVAVNIIYINLFLAEVFSSIQDLRINCKLVF